jgi:hypothetical protein
MEEELLALTKYFAVLVWVRGGEKGISVRSFFEFQRMRIHRYSFQAMN